MIIIYTISPHTRVRGYKTKVALHERPQTSVSLKSPTSAIISVLLVPTRILVGIVGLEPELILKNLITTRVSILKADIAGKQIIH